MALQDEIKKFVASDKYDQDTSQGFLGLLESGSYIRDKGAKKHFSVYFLPYNPARKEIFIVHHKKSGLWLSPGGHMDTGETPLDTLKREIKEELGIGYDPSEQAEPFFLSTVEITNPNVPQCEKHYDIWYLLETDGDTFDIDSREFLETRWITPAQARALVTDPSTLKAIDLVERIFKPHHLL